MIRRFLRYALFLAGGLAALQAAAEVKVILKDGRTFSLPLSAGEIDRLEVDGDPWRPETRDEKLDRVVGGGDARPAPASQLPAAPKPAKRAQAPKAPPVAAGAGRLLKVGPGRDLRTPSAAAKAARDGDIVEIDAAEYVGDVAVWRANNLTIRGVGGRPVLDAGGQAAEGKGIWLTRGSNITIENIAFKNARVRDKNGAGIRAQGGNLTVRRCLFTSNENGILVSKSPRATVLVEHSEFAGNGHGDGQSHAIYVNRVASFIFRFNYVHRTRIGHHVKTRADQNLIAYNLLYDGDDGASSYAVDLNNPVSAMVIGNVIHQGKVAENESQVHVGGKAAQGAKVWIVSNTVINERHGGVFVRNRSAIDIEVRNNLLVGAMEMVKGAEINAADNVVGSDKFFVDSEKLDFHLKPGVAAVDAGRKIADAERAATPEFEYVHPADGRKRATNGRLDAGAYELDG